MAMSYRRVWPLLDEMNHLFSEPVANPSFGGRAGGGTTLTPFGKRIVQHYREMENEAHIAFARHLGAMDAAVERRSLRTKTTR